MKLVLPDGSAWIVASALFVLLTVAAGVAVRSRPAGRVLSSAAE
jgi:hypothetical protein